MLKPVLIGAVLAFGVPGLALAQPDVKTDVTRSAGQTTASGSATVTATITAIDAPTRTVTLKTKTGKVEEMVVGEEARNFDQLKVGDVVTIQYREALTLSLKKGSGAATAQEKEISERSAPGAKPGGVMGREVTVVAQVMAVNKEAQIVTVKGPKGRIVDLHVEDPAQMAGIVKGDRVQAVYTQAVAVSVVPGPGK
jgi:Cu/Ag efflux protein CusF